MIDLTAVEALAVMGLKEPVIANSAHKANNLQSGADFSVLQQGRRLEIAADVDEEGPRNLQEIFANMRKS